MNEQAIVDLISEVEEYFGAGQVGLYEFVWILRSDHPELPEGELRPHAAEALRRLLATGSARLIVTHWGQEQREEAASADDVSAHSWDAPEPHGGRYLAVVPSG